MLKHGGGNSYAASSRPIYSFPELRNVEILQCMEDLRIPLSENELLKPSTVIIQRIFEAFADIFMGIGKDQLSQQPNFSVVETLEYPDLHLDSIGLVAFYRLILKLMLQVGIEDFSLRDLIKPEAPRLRIILSAVINFAKFREEQLSVFEEFSRRSEDLAEQQTKLSKRHDELSMRLANVRAKQKEEEPATAKLREEMAKMVQSLREMKKDQNSLSSELESLKAHKTEVAEKLSQTQFFLGNIRQECLKLKSRVVHSPEKLVQILAEMDATAKNEKQNIVQLERKSRELQLKLEALATLEQDLLRTLQGMETLNGDLRKMDEILSRVREEKEAIERQQILAKDLAIKETQLNRQMMAAQDKLNRLQKTQAEKREKMGDRLKKLQGEYELVAQERNIANTKIEHSEKMVKDFEVKMSELRRSHEAEVVSMRNECVILKARILTYTSEVKKHLRIPTGSNNNAMEI